MANQFSNFLPAERFFANSELAEGGCWIWKGRLQRGYGQFTVNKKNVRPHRWIYEQLIGKVSDGLQLDHVVCRNRACVNPYHLEAVTGKENLHRGKANHHYFKRTHCKRGHPFNEKNTYFPKDFSVQGVRRCRVCAAKRNLDRYYRRKIQ